MSSKTAEPEAEATSSQALLSCRATTFIWFFLVFLVVAYYFPCLAGRADFYASDICYFFEPFSRFIGKQLGQGIFPLWNPLIYCGMSQLAVPSPSIFYPPSYFLFLLPFSQGLSSYMIFHQLLFALGAYLFARELKLSREAAILAAISAGLMSYCFALTRNPTLPATASWLPLALFLQRKISTGRSPFQVFWRLSAAISVSMLIAAGRPEVFVPSIFILIMDSSFTAARQFFQERRFSPSTGKALICLATIVLGMAISCPIILPALEWTSLSPRGQGLAETSVFSWSANWFDFLSMIYCHPMGDAFSDMSAKGKIIGNLVLSKHFALPFLNSAYVGPIIVSFAFWAFLSKGWQKRGVFLALLFATSILAAGNFTPVAPVLLKLAPLFSIIRYPVKLLVFPVMILGLAAAVGFDLAQKKQISSRLLKLMFLFWLIPTILALLVFVCPGFCPIGSQYLSDKVYAPIIREANLRLAGSMLAGGLIGMALVLATHLMQKDRIKVRVFWLAIIVALSGSLFYASLLYQDFTSKGFFTARSRLFDYLRDFLDQNAINGVRGRILPLYLFEAGLRMPGANKSNSHPSYQERFYKYARSLGVCNSTVDFALPQSAGYEAAVTEKYSSLLEQAREYGSNYLDGKHEKPISDLPISRFCKLTATQYVLTQESFLKEDLPLPSLDDRYFELFGQSEGNNSRIYKVINPRPRIYFADNIQLLDSWQELKEKLCHPEEIPDDRQDFVYLLKSADSQSIINCQFPKQPPSAIDRHCKFHLDTDNGQSLVLNIETKQAELIVISDQDYPGWKAELDSKPVPILNANLFARSIALPPGKHKLCLSFMPESLINGCAVAAISLLLLVVLCLAV